MPVNARVAQAGIFVSLELVNGIVHQRIIKHTERYQQLKIFDIQTRYFLEKPWFQLCNNILQASFPIIGQVHKNWNTGSKLNQLLLNLFAFGFVLFFFLAQLFFLFWCEFFCAFFLCLFYGFGLVDNGLYILVQTAEPFDFHQSFHRRRISHQTGKSIVIHIDKQCTFPAFGKQGGRCTCHSDVQNLACINLPHGAAIVSDDRKEFDKLRYLLFRVSFVNVQTAAVIGNLFERSVKSKVKHIAFLFDDFFFAAVRCDFPRALHTKRRLKIGFRAGQIAQHKNTCPWLDCNARCQLTAGEGDGLAFQWVTHGFLYRLQSRRTNSSTCTCTDIDGVIMIERILLLHQQIFHRIAGSYIGEEPERMLQDIQQTYIGIRHGRLFGSQLQIIHTGFQISTPNEIQPLLHLIFIDKGSLRPFAFGREKDIQVKLVELALHGDLTDTVWDAVSHHHHAGQCGIRIIVTFPIFLCPLFI